MIAIAIAAMANEALVRDKAEYVFTGKSPLSAARSADICTCYQELSSLTAIVKKLINGVTRYVNKEVTSIVNRYG